MATVNFRNAHDHAVVRTSGDLDRGAVHELVRSVDVFVGEAYVALSHGRLERRQLESFALGSERTRGLVAVVEGPRGAEGRS